MQITFISDTHNLHAQLPLTAGDVLVHCGDFTRHGDLPEVRDFAEFIGAQDFKHKIVIAGNHDWSLETDDYRRNEAEAYFQQQGIIYLNDSGIEIAGIYFWGSPIQPYFCGWAFNRPRGEILREHWKKIPRYTDILLTHTPAYGLLDTCYDGQIVGCEALREALTMINPRIHAFGHIHESYGSLEHNATLFINACNLDEHYAYTNPPISVTI